MAASYPMADYVATNSILTRIPVASAIFSNVLSVKPAYSPLSILEIACCPGRGYG